MNNTSSYATLLSALRQMLSLHMSHVAHQGLGVFLLLPRWDASPLQGYPQH